MGRRQRIDTVIGAVTAMMSAVTPLRPPAHISVPAGALPFWDAIIRARPREDWEAAPALINAAANLAWTQWKIDDCRRLIDAPDEERGDVAVAQLSSQLLKMQRLEMGYLRMLQQHGRAVGGEARDVAKRRDLAREIEADSPLGDDLIARPVMQ